MALAAGIRASKSALSVWLLPVLNRTAGSHLLVNHQRVPTGPVGLEWWVIDVLASALDLITHSPYFGLVLDVEKQNSITLTAHPLE